MSRPTPLAGPILVVGLDAWGDRVSEAVGAHIGHPLMAELHVLVASELDDAEATRAQLTLEGILLSGHDLPFVTIVQAVDGVWIGPTVVSGLPGCTACWYAQRGEGAGLLTSAERPLRRGRRDDDVALAAHGLLMVGGRLLRGSAGDPPLTRRFRTAGRPPDLGRVRPAAGCPGCDPRAHAVAGAVEGARVRAAVISIAEHR